MSTQQIEELKRTTRVAADWDSSFVVARIREVKLNEEQKELLLMVMENHRTFAAEAGAYLAGHLIERNKNYPRREEGMEEFRLFQTGYGNIIARRIREALATDYRFFASL